METSLLFTTVQGRAIWAPVEKIQFLEQGEGGLTTAVHLFPMTGPKGMGIMILEVEGLVRDHGARVDAARAFMIAAGKPVDTNAAAA